MLKYISDLFKVIQSSNLENWNPIQILPVTHILAQKMEQQMFSLVFASDVLEVGHLVWKLKHKYA